MELIDITKTLSSDICQATAIKSRLKTIKIRLIKSGVKIRMIARPRGRREKNEKPLSVKQKLSSS